MARLVALLVAAAALLALAAQPASAVTFSVATPSVDEGGTARVTATREDGETGEIRLSVEGAGDAPALPGIDLERREATLSGPSVEMSIPVHRDDVDEPGETFRVRGSGSVSELITIRDGTPAPTLSVRDLAVAEDGGSGVVVVDASGTSTQPIYADLVTQARTATSGEDFVSVVQRIVIPPGGRTAEVSLRPIDDQRSEAEETLAVLLSNPAAATIADGEGVVTIVDDEPDPPGPPGDTTAPRLGLSRPVLRAGVIRVTVRCPRTETLCAGRLTLRSRRGDFTTKRLGTMRFSLAGGARATLRIRLARGTRRALRRGRALRVRAVATAKDAALNSASRRRSATLRIRR